MNESKDPNEIREYAGGWITERKGTDVPAFLRFAFIVIAAGCVAYLFFYMNGETGHIDRGALVRQFNQATGSANGFMYAVAGLAIVFGAIVAVYAFKKLREGE